MERCGHALCSYIILEPLLCTTSPWSMTCVLSSGAFHLCWPTSAHYRLLVRAWAHIVPLASLTSHIYRGRTKSLHIIVIILFLFA
jgi:hypothetical protein